MERSQEVTSEIETQRKFVVFIIIFYETVVTVVGILYMHYYFVVYKQLWIFCIYMSARYGFYFLFFIFNKEREYLNNYIKAFPFVLFLLAKLFYNIPCIIY